MSKKIETNTWKDGLNKDLNPVITPNTVLTDNLNGTFITYNGNELSLQNDMGNTFATELSNGFFPIGMTEYGGIFYIVSINENGAFEIGSYPSLDPNESEELELDFEQVYRPFHNLLKDGELSDFNTNNLIGYDVNHPVSIEVQHSYDGSVNLILTDGKNIPRLINSGFAVLGNGKGKFIKRNQNVKSNHYLEENLNQLTKLINTTPSFSYVDLVEIGSGGQLKGGNYTFYFKLGDEDGNQTDIICESGIVSVFKGTIGKPNTISGAFANELTDKRVDLTVHDVDPSYSRLYVYYTREYCDLNGFRLTEAYSITNAFPIKGNDVDLSITGFEQSEPISVEELNIKYLSVNSAKASSQQQNMLFLGNLDIEEKDSNELQDLSYNVIVGVKVERNISNITKNYTPFSGNPNEEEDYNPYGTYYNPKDIYYRLGYWPNELYRFGIVYIRDDGSLTQVYNLKGCSLNVNDTNAKIEKIESSDKVFIDHEESENETYALANVVGVFKTPDIDILQGSQTLGFQFEIDESTQNRLNELGIIGYKIVRQKRIPITICQGFSLGINKYSYFPMLRESEEKGFYVENFVDKQGHLCYYPINQRYTVIDNPQYDVPAIFYFYVRPEVDLNKPKVKNLMMYLCGPKGDDLDHRWYYHGFTDERDTEIAINALKSYITTEFEHKKSQEEIPSNATLDENTVYRSGLINHNNYYNGSITDSYSVYLQESQSECAGLLSLDASINPQLQSMLDGSSFNIVSKYKCGINRNATIFTAIPIKDSDPTEKTVQLVYLPENTYVKYVNNKYFSNTIGDGINVDQFGVSDLSQGKNVYTEDRNVVRGLFTPYIAVAGDIDNKFSYIYDIRIPHDTTYANDVKVRATDSSEFYAVSDRKRLDETIDVYRGDCFKNLVTVRMHRNFIDQTAPIADKIVDKMCWADNYKGSQDVVKESERGTTAAEGKTDWLNINISDLNTVSLGHWVTYPCLSNSNLGLRSEDTTNVSEMSILGHPRSFYPLSDASTATGTKVADSLLLNDGYNATLSRKRNSLKLDTPYDKNEFSTRIIFSNVSVTDAFTNGYRVFQGLSYHDYTKQYGSIIKLLPWGNNLFCVFEHGLAIVPVNEKALMQTTTEQTIHIYGHGVLPEQLSIISQDFGSLWADSVIRTPVGIYGVDTSAKKIWRFSERGFEILSDVKIQRFLNENLIVGLAKSENLLNINVKTHYNNYKGDVMFTFYNGDNTWNMCYNERQSLWVTRYSWLPMFSGNIDNSFYSIEKSGFKDSPIQLYRHGWNKEDTLYLPCKWYDKQYPFEFEFVVNNPAGLHKIFDNLMIISNNVQPTEIEFEFIGDTYLFNKSKIYHTAVDNSKLSIYQREGTDIPYVNDGGKDIYRDVIDFSPMFYNARVDYDKVLDQYTLIVNQLCKNKESYGVRLGNIQYKEDGWYMNIDPLRYNVNLKNPTVTEFASSDQFASARLRDKWVKIRIKYTGDQLALINAVTTFETLSYA